MTYEKQPPLEATPYKRVARKDCQHDEYIHTDYVLWCDVRLPPATTIRAGCTLETLIAAMEAEGRPESFTAPPSKREEELREALQCAANKFWEYVILHQDKHTPDGDEKAARNREMAEQCEAALAKGRAQ